MTKIIAQIPRMKMRQTINLWQNAIRILEDDAKKRQHTEAAVVLEVIKREWIRRRRKPINPEDIFHWPSTDSRPGSSGFDTEDWIKEGVLQYMGYRVGNTAGEPPRIRERILSEILKGPIPPAFHPDYMDEWGEPATVPRLKKLAETIAALTRNAKRRRDTQMLAAIRDWEADLEFL
jgi:hypothetical protein